MSIRQIFNLDYFNRIILLLIIILLLAYHLLTTSAYLISYCVLPTTDGLSSDRLTFTSCVPPTTDGPSSVHLTSLLETYFPTRSWYNESSLFSCILLISFYPRTMSLNFLNRAPCSGFVKKPAIIFSVRKYSTFIPSDCNLSLIQKYLLYIWLVSVH